MSAAGGGGLGAHAWLLVFLKALEAAVPPPPKCHHAVTFNRYGSDAAGWDDRLGLHVWVGATERATFFIDPADFGRHPDDVAREVVWAVVRGLADAG